jgi:hypothetical protein
LERRTTRNGRIYQNIDEPEIITNKNSKVALDSRTVATADDSMAFVKNQTSMTQRHKAEQVLRQMNGMDQK